MAPWILYALLAAAVSAASTVIDKAVLTQWMAKPAGSYFMYGAIETLSGVIALAALGGPRLPFLTAVLALAVGAVYGFSTLMYFQAIQVGEVTRLVPLYSLSPILVAGFAAVFLGEIFSPQKYFGVGLIIIGSLLLSMRRIREFRPGKGVGWMLFGVGLIAANAIVSKYLLGQADPWALFAYTKLGTAFAWVPFWGSGYPAFREAVRRHARPVLAFTLLSEALTAVMTIFFLLAASTSYVTLVGALFGTQQFFLLLFTVLVGIYNKDLLREELDRRLIARKAAALALMFAGVGLVVR